MSQLSGWCLNIFPTDRSFVREKRRIAPELREELTQLKEQAQEEEEKIPSRFIFEGLPLLMCPKGGVGFNWIMENGKITLAVNRGAKMPLLGQVRISSEYLWQVRDPGKVISDVYLFLTSVFGKYITLQVSACDLAVDVVGLNLGSAADIKERFITRAQLDDEMPADSREDGFLDGPESIKRRWRRITGLPFGARNGRLSALLYDKTHEIKYKSPEKVWFHDLWRSVQEPDEEGQLVPLWDGVAPVWRVELRFKRALLNELKVEGEYHGIDDAFSLEAFLPDLWSYAVGQVGGGLDGLPDGWLRYVIPAQDTNCSRWLVHPDWKVIQTAFTPLPLPETPLMQQEREREELLQERDAYLDQHPLSTSKTPGPRHRASSKDKNVSSFAAIPFPHINMREIIRERKREVNTRRMIAQIVGCAVTYEAWRRPAGKHRNQEIEPDLSATFHFLFNHGQDYLEEMERDFAQLVQKKRLLYSVDRGTTAKHTV